MPMKDLVAHEGSGSRAPTARETELAGSPLKALREPKRAERLLTPKGDRRFLRVSNLVARQG